jgi:hypothetical protein
MHRMRTPFTLIDAGTASELDAEVDSGRVLLSAADVARSTGWEHKPEGMCRGEVCIPLRDPQVATEDGRLDLARLAGALQRPLALDVEESAAFLGTAASERAQPLHALQAPDFTLPDLSGRMHSLSEHRGKKVLLVAYASW